MSITDLSQYLESLNGQHFLFQPNPGNAGDSIIAHATFQLFKRLGLSFELFNKKSYREGKSVVLYGGGGNLTRYHHAREFIQHYHRSAKKLVILPHTISDHEDLLSQLGSNVDIICREKVTFEHVAKHSRNARVLLMEDVALSLDIQDTLSSDVKNLRRNLLSKSLLKASVREAGRLLVSLPQHGARPNSEEQDGRPAILHCFRTDREKTAMPLPPDNIDVSGKFAYGAYNETVCRYVTLQVLQFLKPYSEIHTNRLHMAITGALLGKKVKLHPNNYYKCGAVYEYSMKEKFPNVEWMA